MKVPTLKALVAVGLLALLVNSGYIAAFAHPTIFYMANVLGHLVLGIGLAIAFAVLLLRDADVRRRTAASTLLFVVALGFGLWLTWYGNIREHAWALRAHIVAAVLGVAALGRYAMRLAQSHGPSRSFGRALQAVAVVALVFPLVAMTYAERFPPPSSRIVNPSAPPLTMEGEGGGPASPFF